MKTKRSKTFYLGVVELLSSGKEKEVSFKTKDLQEALKLANQEGGYEGDVYYDIACFEKHWSAAGGTVVETTERLNKKGRPRFNKEYNGIFETIRTSMGAAERKEEKKEEVKEKKRGVSKKTLFLVEKLLKELSKADWVITLSAFHRIAKTKGDVKTNLKRLEEVVKDNSGVDLAIDWTRIDKEIKTLKDPSKNLQLLHNFMEEHKIEKEEEKKEEVKEEKKVKKELKKIKSGREVEILYYISHLLLNSTSRVISKFDLMSILANNSLKRFDLSTDELNNIVSSADFLSLTGDTVGFASGIDRYFTIKELEKIYTPMTDMRVEYLVISGDDSKILDLFPGSKIIRKLTGGETIVGLNISNSITDLIQLTEFLIDNPLGENDFFLNQEFSDRIEQTKSILRGLTHSLFKSKLGKTSKDALDYTLQMIQCEYTPY